MSRFVWGAFVSARRFLCSAKIRFLSEDGGIKKIVIPAIIAVLLILAVVMFRDYIKNWLWSIYGTADI